MRTRFCKPRKNGFGLSHLVQGYDSSGEADSSVQGTVDGLEFVRSCRESFFCLFSFWGGGVAHGGVIFRRYPFLDGCKGIPNEVPPKAKRTHTDIVRSAVDILVKGQQLNAWMQWIERGRDGGVEGWRDGGMEGWRDGGMEGRRDGGMEGWRDGGMEGWRDGEIEGGMAPPGFAALRHDLPAAVGL